MRRLPLAILLVVITALPMAHPAGAAVPAVGTPALSVVPIVSNLDRPWDLAFVPDGTMFFTERAGKLSVRKTNGTVQQLTADMSDLWVSVETGLMGIESDPAFTSNHRIYTCQGKLPNTVQVIAWTIDANYTTATRVNNPLLGGIMGTSGRHGGCSLRVDADGFLQVGPGDAAYGANPQDPQQLAGKTLRVDRFSGAGVAGNPFFSGGGDARIYTTGHRNVQGLALRPGTHQMWAIEQGTDRDDEVNLLSAGGNYGWDPKNPSDPPSTYDESHAMTDRAKFPNAVSAAWSSGFPTLATTSGTFLRGDGWGNYEGMLAVTTLKDATLRLFAFDASGRLTSTALPPELNKTYGRLRGAEMGPGGILYLTTDSDTGQDQILAVTPAIADGPSIALSSTNVIDGAVRAYDGSTVVRTMSGGTWGPYTSIGGLTTASPDVASSSSGRLDVTVRGVDNAVWVQSRQSGQWLGWGSLGGIATSGPAIASPALNRLDVFVRGNDGALWHRSFDGQNWRPWEPLGGLLASEPDATSSGPNQLDVFVRGVDNALWRRSFDGQSWRPWESLGGILTSGPGTTSVAPGRLDVMVRGNDGAAWQRRLSGGQWSSWTGRGGLLTSSPDLAALGANVVALVRGIDGNQYQMTIDSSPNPQWAIVG